MPPVSLLLTGVIAAPARPHHKGCTMRKTSWLALVGIIGTIGIGLGLTGTARSQLPAAPGPDTFPKELAKATKFEDETVDALLKALGPAVRQQIVAGRQVSVTGLGTFRVVRLSESRNLEDGRVVVQPARNVIEFLPDAAIEQAANAPGTVPVVEVPAFQYNTLPGQTPRQRVPSGSGRSPSTRVR
jgi:nucleoid DNA-binding protein